MNFSAAWQEQNANTVQTLIRLNMRPTSWIDVQMMNLCGSSVALRGTRLQRFILNFVHALFSNTVFVLAHSDLSRRLELKTVFGFIWFDQFLMLNTQSFCPTKHSAIPFCVKQLLSSATFDLWSTKLGSKAFANTSGIRHSCHPWFWGLPCTTDFQNNTILKNSDFVVRKTPDICPAMAPIMKSHSLRTWNAREFFSENKLSGHKSNHLKTLNLRCKTLMLHVLYIHLPWLLSSARFKLINSQFHHVHLFFEMFIWLCGWQNHCKTHDIPKPIRISKASGRQHLKSLWGHSGGSQWPEIFANGVYRIPRHHGSGFRQLFSNKCCCKQNL